MKCIDENICVVIPAYNEELTIQATINEFIHHLPKSTIMVIDNKSKDKTKEKIEELALHNSNIKYIYEPYKGKANAVRRGFMECDFDYYLMVDADTTYPADEAWKLIKVMNDNVADMVVGDRISNGRYGIENKRKFHNFGNELIKKMLLVMFGIKVNDALSGYRLMSKRFVKCYPIIVDGFELETDLTIHSVINKMRIREVPILYRDRPNGSESKLSTFTDGAKIIALMIKMYARYKPIKFSSIISLPILISSLYAGTSVISEYYNTGVILKIPSAIYAVGGVLLFTIIVLIGIVLSVRNEVDRKNRELMFLATR